MLLQHVWVLVVQLVLLAGSSQEYPNKALAAIGFSSIISLAVSRYSTARSGLLNAALIARSISVLGNPMLSILEIAAARSDPRAKADGSLKLPPSVVAPPDAAGAGDGVDGTFDDEVLWAATGAGGGAGVCAGAGVGVEGGFTEEDAAEELPGATFGWFMFSKSIIVIQFSDNTPLKPYTQ